MPIQFRCYQCNKPLATKGGKEGHTVRCPFCRAPLIVPGKPNNAAMFLLGTDESTLVDIPKWQAIAPGQESEDDPSDEEE